MTNAKLYLVLSMYDQLDIVFVKMSFDRIWTFDFNVIYYFCCLSNLKITSAPLQTGPMTGTLPHPGHKIFRKWECCCPMAAITSHWRTATHQNTTQTPGPRSSGRELEGVNERRIWVGRSTETTPITPNTLRTTLGATIVLKPEVSTRHCIPLHVPLKTTRRTLAVKSRNLSQKTALPSFSRHWGKRVASGRNPQTGRFEAAIGPQREGKAQKHAVALWIAPQHVKMAPLLTGVGQNPWTEGQNTHNVIILQNKYLVVLITFSTNRLELWKGISSPSRNRSLRHPAGATKKRATSPPLQRDPIMAWRMGFLPLSGRRGFGAMAHHRDATGGNQTAAAIAVTLRRRPHPGWKITTMPWKPTARSQFPSPRDGFTKKIKPISASEHGRPITINTQPAG